MTTVTLSLVSHTNVGKTTLARTLLGRDIGEVRDAPHVTEFAAVHELIASREGDRLRLADTPGFGNTARLVARLQGRSNPIGWFLAEVWDRWHDRAFWATQRALRHVRDESDVLLYLVNAAESPASAGYVGPEMELMGWIGKPVLVLLNQLGPPRPAGDDAAEVDAWRTHLARWPQVRGVLPLDAFARCWVHEATLLRAVQHALDGEAAAAMGRLSAAWESQRQATYEAALDETAASLGRIAAARVAVDDGDAAGEGAGALARLRRFGTGLGASVANAVAGAASGGRGRRAADDPASRAQATLNAAFDAEMQASLERLIALHRLEGHAQAEITQRVARQFAVRQRVDEGSAALLGGAVSGALVGLKADVASGGLTLGGGLLAGALLGALGAAGIARGVNVVRGTGHSWVAWSDEAMASFVDASLLRYLAVAHFGRGRGEWAQSEAPPHWRDTVAAALAPHRSAFDAVWRTRSERYGNAGEADRLAGALRPLLGAALHDVFDRLYPAHAGPARGGDDGDVVPLAPPRSM